MSAAPSILEIPKEPAIRRAWVIYQLRIRGWSLSQVGAEIGITRQAAADALLKPSSHVERAIAKKLGLRVQDLFPERFDSSGRRLHRTRSPERSSRSGGNNVQLRERA